MGGLVGLNMRRVTPDFSTFDSSGLRTLSVHEGYGTWAGSYEDTVDDRLDLDLLAGLDGVRWGEAARVADLACGTGRTASWLRTHGAGADHIHGVDTTPEMLARARDRGEHDRLVEADVGETGLPDGAYDLVVASLVDHHLASLRPLYREARRLTADGAPFVLAGIHPFVLMVTGTPTRLTVAGGEEVAIETHVHLLSAHLEAARAAGFVPGDLREAVVDDTWVASHERWTRWRGYPVSFATVWR